MSKLVLAEHALWDLNVYQSAVDAARTGEQVYGVPFNNLYFVYPPAVLKAFAWLGSWLTPLFLAAYAATLACFLAYAPVTLRWALLCYFGVLAFVTEPLTTAVRTGNVSVFATLLLLLFWRLSPRLGPGPLLGAIAVFSCIKPQYAAFLALWLFVGRVEPVAILRSMSVLVVILTAWGAQAVFSPEMFQAFLTSLDAQLQIGDESADMGVGVFALVHRLTQSGSMSLLALIAVWAGIALYWFWILARARHIGGETARALILNGAFLLCLLASPRLKIYDTGILGLICVETVLLWGVSLGNASRWLWPVLTLAVCMLSLRLFLETGWLFDRDLHLFDRRQSVVLLAAFGLSAWAITRDGPQTPGERLVKTRI